LAGVDICDCESDPSGVLFNDPLPQAAMMQAVAAVTHTFAGNPSRFSLFISCPP
jgi:hypothetical protein